MANLGISVIFLLLIAAIIIIISVWAYNRRLDKVTRGEIHGTHTNLPEPGTTAGVTYRIVLMILAIAVLFGISNIHGLIVAENSQINSLQQTQFQLSREISELQMQLEEMNRKVTESYWEVEELNYEKQFVRIQYYAKMRQYSDDAQLTLHLSGMDIPLIKKEDGLFAGRVTMQFFDDYSTANVSIKENGVTTIEQADIPQYIFWNYLPMPSLQCNLVSDFKYGKWNYEGQYKIDLSNTEQVSKVSLTYLTGGKELKPAIDVTQEVLNGTWITLEKGMDLTTDLTIRMEVTAKDGLRIVEQQVLMYETSPDYQDDDYTKIYDADGKLLWEDEFKK